MNDEIPLFTEREQETVLEGEPIGTKVTQVNAIDKDGTFPNNQVIFPFFPRIIIVPIFMIIYNIRTFTTFQQFSPFPNIFTISTISSISTISVRKKADLSHFLIVMQHAVFWPKKKVGFCLSGGMFWRELSTCKYFILWALPGIPKSSESLSYFRIFVFSCTWHNHFGLQIIGHP